MSASTVNVAELLRRFPSRVSSNGNLVLPPGRLSYPHLFKPRVRTNKSGTTKKYECSVLFPKAADLSLAASLAEAAIAETWPQKRGAFRRPLRDQQDLIDRLPAGSADAALYQPGAKFINCNSPGDSPRPACRTTKGGIQVDCTEADIYPGCWVIVSVRVKTYSNDENKGCTFYLQNVFKCADDTRIGGGGAGDPDEDFSGMRAMEVVGGAAAVLPGEDELP